MFVDVAKINIKSGDGGNGAVAFHREKYVTNGGPDGGDGGRGGDIIFTVSQSMRTLLDFRYTRNYKAGNGENGQSNLRKGKQGENIVIQVPRGTILRDAQTNRIIADMFEMDASVTILRGGNGGKGNARFKSPTRQAPNFAQNGEVTKERCVILELKTIADVGLVGFPNVGKSTILSVITRARPKIANYHFTTLSPNLGVTQVDGQSFVVADIPGLIEGAAQGVGLGYDFLRHVERTRMLLHVVDISGSEGRDPIEDYYAINKELREYSEVLGDLKQLIVANKSELPGSEENVERLKAATQQEVFVVSAATGKGFTELLRKTGSILATLPPAEPIASVSEGLWEVVDPNAFEITRQNEIYVVSGPLMDRLAAAVTLDDPDSFNYFQRVLRERDVIKALVAKGAKDGSVISIGDIEFDFVE